MDLSEFKHLERVREELSALPSNLVIDAEQVLVLYMFNMYLVNLADARGLEIVGHTLRHKEGLDLLVVKSRVDGDPMVCFISGRTPYNCMKIFLRRLLENTCEWREDRYA